LIADLETRVEQLRASEVDMKNLFYREKEAREVLEYDYKQLAYECDKHMELRIASDRDLVNCYKSLQKLNEDCEKLRAQLKELEEAALPIARLLVPHPRTEDSSLGEPAERSSQSSSDVRQALGEIDPQPDLGIYEVVLPKGSS
jgi:chromosome segregation ATPase